VKIKIHACRSQRLSNAFALTADVVIMETTNTGAWALVINQAKVLNVSREERQGFSLFKSTTRSLT
jgi:hypothetical protein